MRPKSPLLSYLGQGGLEAVKVVLLRLGCLLGQLLAPCARLELGNSTYDGGGQPGCGWSINISTWQRGPRRSCVANSCSLRLAARLHTQLGELSAETMILAVHC